MGLKIIPLPKSWWIDKVCVALAHHLYRIVMQWNSRGSRKSTAKILCGVAANFATAKQNEAVEELSLKKKEAKHMNHTTKYLS